MPNDRKRTHDGPDNFEQVVEFGAAHDCMRIQPCKFGSTACQPNAGGSHGIGSVDMRMVLKGPLGAVQFVLYTGWYLDETPRLRPLEPMAADLGYHSPKPRYESQYSMGPCTYLNDEPCFYDGSSLNAEEPWRILRYEGGDAVWAYLREYYADIFERAEADA